MNTERRIRIYAVTTVLLAGLIMTACGNGGALARLPALIRGQVVGIDPLGGISVRAAAGALSSVTDASGQFQLARPPEDNVRLRFVRSVDDINAEVALDRSADISGHLVITVRVKGHEAELVELEHEDLGELKGRVVSLDREAMRLALLGGQEISLDAETVWDPTGDLLSLEALEAALQQGAQARVEGSGSMKGGAFLAAIIKAEVEEGEIEPGDDQGAIEPDDDRGRRSTK